jgi:hypothetical protein
MASPIMRYFDHGHLPADLADVSERFASLANWCDQLLADGPEKSVTLRKLLEAKDAAVRSALP